MQQTSKIAPTTAEKNRERLQRAQHAIDELSVEAVRPGFFGRVIVELIFQDGLAIGVESRLQKSMRF